jgi:hypothetical protein
VVAIQNELLAPGRRLQHHAFVYPLPAGFIAVVGQHGPTTFWIKPFWQQPQARSAARWLRKLQLLCEAGEQSSAGYVNRSSKEYLKILKLAAEQGEVQVDEALRELLEGRLEIAITVEAIGELLAKLDTITPVTMVEVAPVDLASFDQLCLDMQVRQ